MCDYSLLSVSNRLASTGEDLVVHRFPGGSKGLASRADLIRAKESKPAERVSFWTAMKMFFCPIGESDVPAVCIPPAARLRLYGIDRDFQHKHKVQACEEVVFEQLTAESHVYRDAIRFDNGTSLLLQDLPEGQHMVVVDLGCDAAPDYALTPETAIPAFPPYPRDRRTW